MSVELLELAAAALDDLLPEVVFLGGAVVGLWITDPAAPPVRPTKDVDVVVEVTTRLAFHDFESRLRARGFLHDQEDGVICRWRHRESDKGRGRGDFLAAVTSATSSRSWTAGAELLDDVARADDDVRHYLAEEISALLSAPRFADGLFGALRPDAGSQARAEEVVLPALGALAAGGSHGEVLERLRSEVRGAGRRSVSAVDELIADRRLEARREDSEEKPRA